MSDAVLSPRALGRATLARQALLAREPTTVVDMVERLFGMQAQEPRPPFVGLWTRIEGFGREQLADALQRRDVVRATLMRGTLHLVSARDLRTLRPTLHEMLLTALRGPLRGRDEGLDLDALLPVARRLVEPDGRTFEELRALLVEAFPGVNDRALGYATRLALPLVMVPTDDAWSFPTASRFTTADAWLGRKLAAKPDLEAMVLRYLAAYGPAGVADVQTWSGVGGLKEVVEALRPQLVAFRAGRRELFDLPDAPRPDEDAEAPPRFLPPFDQILLAHADRSRVIAGAHKGAVFTKNLRVNATILVDGVVAGTWTATRTAKRATVTVAPFGRLAKAGRAALTEEGEALARFLEPDAQTHAVTFA